jgi:hypothetical protein
MRGRAIRHGLSLRRAFQNCGERVVGRRGVVLMEIITDHPVNSKLLSSLVAKGSTETLRFGQSSTATSSAAREISRD